MNSPHCSNLRSSFATALFILFLSPPLHGQDPVALVPGKMVEREIAGKEKQQYKLQLGANAFFYAVAEQKGVDIVVRLISPGGRTLQEFDSPNGTRGPEYILATTDSAGIYTLEVTPLGEAGTGRYTLFLDRVEPAGTDVAARADQLMSPWKGTESPGASIGVVMDGKLVFAKGYGMADLESGIPNNPQTIFHMASVSKQFTAMAILMLADQGKLSLDDSIQQYLPEMTNFGKRITIRHLLHHTSGLRDQWSLWAMAGGRMDDVIAQDELYRLVARQRELNFVPGTEHLYSNTGYMLLARIVERVAGVPFREWMKKNVFAPLGMTHTQIYDDHQRIVRGRAYSFEADSAGFHKSVLSYANSGATSLFSTVEDLALWLNNFRDPRVGGERVLQMMQQRGVLTGGDTLSYASGIMVDRYRGLRRFSHSGGDAGYRTYIASFPDIGGGVIVLSNLGSFNPAGIASQIVDACFADKFETAKTVPASAASTPKPAEISLPRSVLSAYEGRYFLQEAPTIVLAMTIEGGRLYSQVTGQPRVLLHATSDTTFFITEAQASFTFHRQPGKSVERFTLHQNGNHVAERVAASSSGKEQASVLEYAGRYYSPELETIYTLVIRNGKLFATHHRLADIELKMGAKDQFGGTTWFFGQTAFERGAGGTITGMRVSNGRVRNLLFVRQDVGTLQALKP